MGKLGLGGLTSVCNPALGRYKWLGCGGGQESLEALLLGLAPCTDHYQPRELTTLSAKAHLPKPGKG